MLVAIENSFFMIESSFSIGPKSESLREQLISPFSLVLSPGLWPESSECLELATEEIPRCSNCGTYFSKFSSNVGKKYTCSTCMHNEEVSEDKFIPNLENYQVKLNDSVGEEINVIYISLDFNNKDLKLILGSVCIMLKHLNNKNVIVMVGDNVSPFSFLTPAISCFEMDDDGKIMINEDRRKEINKDDHFMAPICHIFDDSINITKFIFVPEQIQCIINTLKNIKPVSVEVPLVYLYNAITLLNNHSGNSIIHFISILSIFNDENKDYKEILKIKTSIFNKFYSMDESNKAQRRDNNNNTVQVQENKLSKQVYNFTSIKEANNSYEWEKPVLNDKRENFKYIRDEILECDKILIKNIVHLNHKPNDSLLFEISQMTGDYSITDIISKLKPKYGENMKDEEFSNLVWYNIGRLKTLNEYKKKK